MKRRLPEILSLLLLLMVASACSGKKKEANAADPASNMNKPSEVAQTEPASAPKKPAISFEAVDTKGVKHSSSEWIGKQPTVVNLWGTWCPPCRREIPDLVKLYAEYHPKGVEVLGLAMRDTPEKAAQFAQANDMKWIMLIGTLDIARKFQTGSVPLTVFYDRSGKEVDRMIGAQTYDSFKKGFEEITQK